MMFFNKLFDKNKDIGLISIPIYLFNEKNYKLNYKFDKKNETDLIRSRRRFLRQGNECAGYHPSRSVMLL